MSPLSVQATQNGALVTDFDSWVIGAHVPTLAAFCAWALTNHYQVLVVMSSGVGKPPRQVYVKM